MTARRLLVDTNIWGASLNPKSEPLARRFAKHLAGAEVAIATQTVAELRFGALAAGWGQRRMERLERHVHRAIVIPVDDHLVWTHAHLRAACRRAGHPLQDKVHAGDMWIAASALAAGLPLVTDDGVFNGAPGLQVIHEP